MSASAETVVDPGVPARSAWRKRIDLGPYSAWSAPARAYLNVERAYREFRNETTDATWDHAKAFDAIFAVAKARGIRLEF